jgi:hypothetical protein
MGRANKSVDKTIKYVNRTVCVIDARTSIIHYFYVNISKYKSLHIQLHISLICIGQCNNNVIKMK